MPDHPRRPELARSKTLDPATLSNTATRTVLEDITGLLNVHGPSLGRAPSPSSPSSDVPAEPSRTRLLAPRSFGLRRANTYAPSSLSPSAGVPSSSPSSSPSLSATFTSSFASSPPPSPSLGCLRAPAPRRGTSEGPRSPRLC